jgi:hypothetical protein
MSENESYKEVSGLVKNAFTFKNANDYATFCHKARYSCERILQIIYSQEVNPLPNNIGFDKMLNSIVEKNKYTIPLEIRNLIESIRATGNSNSHPNQLTDKMRKRQADVASHSLSFICNWFFNEYLQLEIKDELIIVDKLNYLDAQEKNYRDLIIASLSDGILELDEYEQIIDARINMNLKDVTAKNIEKEIVAELLKKNINDLSEILNPTDLSSFKKYDIKHNLKPDWVKKGIESLNESPEHSILKSYLKYYFDEIPNDIFNNVPIILNLLGCWQGWYFQYESKTYFNLFFIAKSENQFIGYCIEPVNPTWSRNSSSDQSFLFAAVEGELEDEILFRFTKTMLMKNSWNINYEGVLIEDGQFFEGEWSIRTLNGAFNAMKTKSLLPVRIFDTNRLLPVVKTQYLDHFQNLTSSWFVQLQGKNAHFGILHLIDFDENSLSEFGTNFTDIEQNGESGSLIQANLIMQENERLLIDFMQGYYENPGKVILNSAHAIQGEFVLRKLNFSVDWNQKVISGTIKDEHYKMRSFKGYKI